MTERIKNFLIENFGDYELTLLVIGLVSVFSAFVITLLFGLLKKEFGFFKRIWFLFFCCGIILTQAALSYACGGDFFGCLLLSGIGVICFSVVTLLPTKKEKPVKVSEEQSSFVKFLDAKINADSGAEEQTENIETQRELSPERLVVKEEVQTKPQKEIDFSHVKNIISRLNYFGLSAADKRLLGDLEISVAEAEKGDCGRELKQKINEGLGALLKIMAKYGA